MTIGEAIRAARTARGWSQRKLAELSGVVPETVCRWETGVVVIPPLQLRGLEAVLGEPLGAEGTVQAKTRGKVARKS